MRRETFRCEGYGPGGTAIVIDCLTTDRSGTVARLRELLSRHGGAMGAPGSVSYLFHSVGRLVFSPQTHARQLVRKALQSGAEDVEVSPEGQIEVLADPREFEALRIALLDSGFIPASSEVTERAATRIVLEGKEAVAARRLLQELGELEDVANVYSNAEISDERLAQL